MNLEDLYDDPRPYQGRIICTDGVLQERFPSVMVVPRWLTEEESGFQHLEIGYNSYNSAAFEPGDRVRVRGRFSFFEDCYDFFVVHGGEMGDVAMICGPPDVPMFVDIESIQRLEP